LAYGSRKISLNHKGREDHEDILCALCVLRGSKSSVAHILRDLSDRQAVIRAVENNPAEYLLLLGNAGGGVEHHDSRLRWTIGGSPVDYHNCVVHTDLPADEADTAIADVVAHLQAARVPGSWHVGPSMRPLDLGERLLRHGYTYGGNEPGMAMDLHALREDVPSGLRIERVRDDTQLDIWARTLAVDFGQGELEANWVRDVYRIIGLGDDVPLRHYLGWLDDEPVATTTLFLGAGVAGIFFVMTVPQARRRGIGAAITLAALHEGRDLGYRVGVLGASEPGAALYARLGFETYCDIGIYEWRE
jgi:GNAT superfamily N-acetyltransferase